MHDFRLNGESWRAYNKWETLALRASRYIRVNLTPLMCMILDVLERFKPFGISTAFGNPGDLVNFANLLSSRYMLTSERCVINIIEDATKRVKSKAPGIGAGVRSFTSTEVHRSEMEPWAPVKGPRRTKSWRQQPSVNYLQAFSIKITWSFLSFQ